MDYPEGAFLFTFENSDQGVYVQVPGDPTSTYLSFRTGFDEFPRDPFNSVEGDGPVSDAALRKFLDAEGFKPAEREWRVGDTVTGESAYASLPLGTVLDYKDEHPKTTYVKVPGGYNDSYGEFLEDGELYSQRVIVALPNISEQDVADAKAARLAYWDALGEPRKSKPKPASLAAWIAAVQAVKPPAAPEPKYKVGGYLEGAEAYRSAPAGLQVEDFAGKITCLGNGWWQDDRHGGIYTSLDVRRTIVGVPA